MSNVLQMGPKYFAALAGKPLGWSLFLIKLQAFRSATLLKKRLQHSCFPVNTSKFLRTGSFFDRTPLMATYVSLLFSILTNQS